MHWKFSHLNVSFMKSLDCHTCFLLFFHTCSHLPFVWCEFCKHSTMCLASLYMNRGGRSISALVTQKVWRSYISIQRPGCNWLSGILEFWNLGPPRSYLLAFQAQYSSHWFSQTCSATPGEYNISTFLPDLSWYASITLFIYITSDARHIVKYLQKLTPHKWQMAMWKNSRKNVWQSNILTS